MWVGGVFKSELVPSLNSALIAMAMLQINAFFCGVIQVLGSSWKMCTKSAGHDDDSDHCCTSIAKEKARSSNTTASFNASILSLYIYRYIYYMYLFVFSLVVKQSSKPHRWASHARPLAQDHPDCSHCKGSAVAAALIFKFKQKIIIIIKSMFRSSWRLKILPVEWSTGPPPLLANRAAYRSG